MGVQTKNGSHKVKMVGIFYSGARRIPEPQWQVLSLCYVCSC